MSDQPTTGEWTAAAVANCLNNRLDAAQTIADAHNAALASESERCEVCNSELSQCGVQGVDGEPSWDCLLCRCRDTLAAEKEKVQTWEGTALDYDCKTPLELAQLMERAEEETERLSKQLAASQKALAEEVDCVHKTLNQLADYKQQAESMLATSKRVNDQLRAHWNELAKLENAQQPLVDALTLCVNTLRDKRIGTVDYMEGSRIYSDFRIAVERGEAALAKVKDGK